MYDNSFIDEDAPISLDYWNQYEEASALDFMSPGSCIIKFADEPKAVLVCAESYLLDDFNEDSLVEVVEKAAIKCCYKRFDRADFITPAYREVWDGEACPDHPAKVVRACLVKGCCHTSLITFYVCYNKGLVYCCRCEHLYYVQYRRDLNSWNFRSMRPSGVVFTGFGGNRSAFKKRKNDVM